MTATLIETATQTPHTRRSTPHRPKWLVAADHAAILLFAFEGALLGIAGGLDLIGVLAVAFLSSLGGGLIRDVLCHTIPPAALNSATYPATALFGGLIAIVGHHTLAPIPPTVRAPLDAAALALFCTVGTIKALDVAMRPLAAIVLGAMSAVGGGIIRDVLLGTIPTALRNDMCAVAALCGASATVVALRFGASRPAAAAAGLITCAGLSLLSAAQGWQMAPITAQPG
jgi:uncharacterized membrane protein YeiH